MISRSGIGPARPVMRLKHSWNLTVEPGLPGGTVRDFLRPAIRAVPRTLAGRLGPCSIRVAHSLGGAGSRWTRTPGRVLVEIAARQTGPHDLALELLVCLGQVLWDAALTREREAWLRLLDAEIRAGAAGEIDEDALAAKRVLLSSRTLARSSRRLEQYARASFAGTAAEYVHALWHDVSVRTGPEYLPATQLARRLRIMARWFPPDRGQKLFPDKTALRPICNAVSPV